MSAFSVNSYASNASSELAPAMNRSRGPALQSSDVAQSANLQQVDATRAPDKPQGKTEKASLDNAVDAINTFLKPVASSLQFSVDEDSGRTLVKVIDTDTNDVLRQFPSKEALALSRDLDKLQGMLLRDKA